MNVTFAPRLSLVTLEIGIHHPVDIFEPRMATDHLRGHNISRLVKNDRLIGCVHNQISIMVPRVLFSLFRLHLVRRCESVNVLL